jgi:signal transduction histidine kinase
MKLRRQFAILTLAAALSPVLVYGAILTFQLLAPDPRVPIRGLVADLAGIYERSGSFPAGEVEAVVAGLDAPSRRFIILSPTMELLYSGLGERPLTPPEVSPNAQTEAAPEGAAPEGARGFAEIYGIFRHPGRRVSLQVIPILRSLRAEAPLLVVDPEPWYARTDLRARLVLYVSILASTALLVTGALSLLILRSLRREITALIAGTERIAGGDLSHELGIVGRDEFGDLARSIDSMRRSLRDAMHRQSLLFMGMSHDMKTPVSLISGYADALAEGMDADGRERERYIGIIRSKSRQLEEIIDEFIGLIKLESGSRGAQLERMEEVDVAAVVSAMARRFGEDAALMGRRFRYEGPADASSPGAQARPSTSGAPAGAGEPSGTPVEEKRHAVRMRKALFERLMENLFSNAVRFGSPEGEILLSLSRDAEGTWTLDISDEGPGIAPEDLPWVFDPFFRGSRSREDGGMGLGLAFARVIADLHGWELSIGPRPDVATGTRARLSMRDAR